MSVILVSPAQVTIASAGTAQQIVAADISGVISVYLSVPAANTGSIFVGDSTASASHGLILIKGNSPVRIDAPQGQYIDLRNIYVDAANSSDKVNIAYLKKVN